MTGFIPGVLKIREGVHQLIGTFRRLPQCDHRHPKGEIGIVQNTHSTPCLVKVIDESRRVLETSRVIVS